MKKIKYLFAFILFFIGFSFSGESFMLYLDTFKDNFSQTTVFKPNLVSDEEMNRSGKTILVVTHDEEIKKRAKRVIQL